MAIHQNFSIQAGDDIALDFDIAISDGITLQGAEVLFEVFPQSHGVPDTTDGPVITKSSLSGGGGVEILASPPNRFVVTLNHADTVDMLHNYYFEAKVVDTNGNNSTVTVGLMCVLPTQIAPV